MIPNIIHYCWFGENELPAHYKAFIDEWQELHPSWTIKRWDETNSPMDLAYMQNAKKHKNWANMSNLVRFYVLLKEGGIYLDTDMKVIKPLRPLATDNCFFGFESGTEGNDEFWVNNAICGAIPGHRFIEMCFENIQTRFDGSEPANESAPKIVTTLLREAYGLNSYGKQVLEDVVLYPKEFFYPIDYNETYKTKEIEHHIYPESFAVHMWGRSWLTADMMLSLIDDLQFDKQNNKSFIAQLQNELDEVKSRTELLTLKLSNVEQINLNHIYDKGLLNETIEKLAQKVHVEESKNLQLLKQQQDQVTGLQNELEKERKEHEDDKQSLAQQIKLLEKNVKNLTEAHTLQENLLIEKLRNLTNVNDLLKKSYELLAHEWQELIALKEKQIEELREITLLNELKHNTDIQHIRERLVHSEQNLFKKESEIEELILKIETELKSRNEMVFYKIFPFFKNSP